MRRHFLSFVALVVVFSCAGYAAPLHQQVVVCFGDSLTAGYGSQPGATYPDFLRADLARDGYPVTVINRGVSGETTKDGLARVDSVLSTHPDIVILELGANDGLRGQPTSGILRNLSTIIAALQAHHIQILLAGIQMPPNFGQDYLQQFNGIYPALAHRYHLRLIPFLLAGVYDDDDLMSEDNVHPNADGYRVIAQKNVLPYLEPMLTK